MLISLLLYHSSLYVVQMKGNCPTHIRDCNNSQSLSSGKYCAKKKRLLETHQHGLGLSLLIRRTGIVLLLLKSTNQMEKSCCGLEQKHWVLLNEFSLHCWTMDLSNRRCHASNCNGISPLLVYSISWLQRQGARRYKNSPQKLPSASKAVEMILISMAEH